MHVCLCFHSLYSGASEEKHIVLLSVRYHGGMRYMEMMEVCWGLSSTSPSYVAQGFLFYLLQFSLISLSLLLHKHMSICAYLYNMHIHFMLMVTQGTFSSQRSALLTFTHFYCSSDDPMCTVSSCSVIPSPRVLLCVLFIWTISEHITTARVVLPVSSLTPLCCRTPAACVLFLLLSDALFLLIEVFSIQPHCISHIFYCNKKRLSCWDHISPFLSWHKNVEASASRLLSVPASWRRGKKHQIGRINEAIFISGAYLSQVDFELKTDNTSLHTAAKQILEEEETSKGKLMFNQSAVEEECVVVL